MRIGHGYDVHRFAKGRKLMLCGVEVDYELGLLGHSDADVLAHAVMDALLGAAALGDIGGMFPDSDERWRGADSLLLLAQVTARLAENGWAIGNVDATVLAQAPKLASYIPEMRRRLAEAMGIDAAQVSVKATTEEHLGFTGAGEGMACHAVALLTAADGAHINVCCVFDNEEVGSGTKQGADSTFLSDVLRRITLSLGHDEADYMAALPRSFMLSADNAHATHPNHPELSDPVNQVYMNEGVVIKFNANQKYTTDGVSEAVFHAICQHADVPVQHFANRSDMPGGSTLGNISGGHVSVNTLDIGLAQLAMHSSYETAGCADVDYMIRALRQFYKTDIITSADGEYQLV